eukprot:GHUV01008552.1.p1 GENE.GHUV01008552.1~~GHUV01008552.1.p1  ORF type:complete len:317 (+),score=105.68 GHUV01008552.1:230-1180(+)
MTNASPPISSSLNLSLEHHKEYLQLKGERTLQLSLLAEALCLPEYRHDARSAIVLDYTAAVLSECDKQQLQYKQTAAILGIAVQLLHVCSRGLGREEAQQVLRSSLLQLCWAGNGKQSSSTDGDLVSLAHDEIASIAELFTRGMLQHYAVYSLVFTKEQHHVQHQYHLMVESTVAAPPLELSLAEPDWHAHLAAEQAQHEAEIAAAAAAEQARKEAEEAARIAQQQAEEAAARQEQLQRKPKTLEEAVDKLVALRLEDVRQGLSEGYAVKAAALAARVGQLEQQAASAATAHAAEQAKNATSGKGSRAGSAARTAA